MEQIDLKDNPLRQIGTLQGHNYEVNGLCFSPDGSLLASTQQGSEDVWIWDMNTQAVLRKIPGYDMAFSPDGTLLAVKTDKITLWNCATWNCVAHLPTSPKQVAFSSDGEALITLDYAGRVAFWNLTSQQKVFSFDAIADLAYPGCLAVATDLPYLAISTTTHEILLWLFDSTTREAIYSAAGKNGEEPMFSPDGKFLATLTSNGVRDTFIRLYDMPGLTNWSDLEPHTRIDSFQSLAFSPDSSYLAVGTTDGMLLLWNIHEKRLIASFAAHSDPGWRQIFGIRVIAWSAGRRCLATGGWESEDPSSLSFSHGEFAIKLWSMDRV